ncbi:MAG TPA: gamma-glutamyl-gamma-aminobutyrate hydrolase family protein [Candidatus Levilactobacillus faecigallinarum]|uniref:Gamma-glutamyl-gamma-aminobutyrate hydrolase family protein n=1 Tax=Candidatus Levilactobacillus faecigallinarum TaxID=2838638 RepID=A0A9D1QRS8_9LACO|nr:gamma-glutamyl-gamma-aminobutyrate hydrolase family protein [Candidatus Levilactobacillus faecigallinarum]
MSKFIGITADVWMGATRVINLQYADFVPRPLVDAVQRTGAIPISLPHLPVAEIDSLLDRLDGLILTGGPDVDPAFMGEDPLPALGITNRDRDQFEIALARQAVARHLPVLGICRGIHVLNVALGGTLYQDLPSQYPVKHLLKHRQAAPGDQPTHFVTVAPSSLQDVVGAHPFVNSRHHQAIKLPGKGLTVTARSNDGVVEAIENSDASVQGVQWHPENLWTTMPEELALFQAFTDRLSPEY